MNRANGLKALIAAKKKKPRTDSQDIDGISSTRSPAGSSTNETKMSTKVETSASNVRSSGSPTAATSAKSKFFKKGQPTTQSLNKNGSSKVSSSTTTTKSPSWLKPTVAKTEDKEKKKTKAVPKPSGSKDSGVPPASSAKRSLDVVYDDAESPLKKKVNVPPEQAFTPPVGSTDSEKDAMEETEEEFDERMRLEAREKILGLKKGKQQVKQEQELKSRLDLAQKSMNLVDNKSKVDSGKMNKREQLKSMYSASGADSLEKLERGMVDVERRQRLHFEDPVLNHFVNKAKTIDNNDEDDEGLEYTSEIVEEEEGDEDGDSNKERKNLEINDNEVHGNEEDNKDTESDWSRSEDDPEDPYRYGAWRPGYNPNKANRNQMNDSNKLKIHGMTGLTFSNRYGITPGPEWDGVDRSTGYESELLQRKLDKRMHKEDVAFNDNIDLEF